MEIKTKEDLINVLKQYDESFKNMQLELDELKQSSVPPKDEEKEETKTEDEKDEKTDVTDGKNVDEISELLFE